MKESGKDILETMGFFKCTLKDYDCRHKTTNDFCMTKEECIHHLIEK